MNSCNRYICRIFCIAIAVLWLFTQPVLLIIAIRLLLNSDVQTSFSMSFQFVRVCDILLYGLNDIFAYVGSIHKTYLLSVIKFVAATTSLLEAFVKSFQKKTEIFTKK